MSKRLQLRRGNTSDVSNFTGAEGELIYDKQTKEIRMHDGVTKGGIAVGYQQLPVGQISFHLGKRTTIKVGEIPLDGLIYNRNDHPELWALVNSGRFEVVTESQWLNGVGGNKYVHRGKFTKGNNTSTFRVPDLNGVQPNSLKNLYLRGASSDSVVGSVEDDAIRNITGTVDAPLDTNQASSFTGVFEAAALKSYGSTSNASRYTFNFDASRVVPTADENRTKSVYGVWVITSKSVFVKDPPTGVSPAVLVGGNTFSGSQKVVGGLEVSNDISTQGSLNGNIKHLLNANGDAPIYARRALAVFNGVNGVVVLREENIASITRISSGRYSCTFRTSMFTKDYAVHVTYQRGDRNHAPDVISTSTTGFEFALPEDGGSGYSKSDSALIMVTVY